MVFAEEATRDGYRIQRAQLRDLRAVRRLESVMFPRDSYSYADLLLLFLGGMLNLKLVAPDGSLAGFVSGGRLLGVGHTWIMTLGVHPDHRGQGLGRWLLETCEGAIRGRSIYLTVRVSNEPALNLYRSSGYRQVRVKYGYYLDGEAGIEMRKDRDQAR